MITYIIHAKQSMLNKEVRTMAKCGGKKGGKKKGGKKKGCGGGR